MEVQNLTDGKQGSDATMAALIKVAITSSPVSSRGNKFNRRWLYLIIAVLGTLLLASVVSNFWQCYASKKAKRRSLLAGLRTFTYKKLKQATNGFKELLGKGGFGEVYKGKLSYLESPHVAVKILIKLRAERDFENEVRSIGQIHHKNLVRMIGYCKEGVHRILVFEYMQGGTLADFIFASQRPGWSFLTEAAIGIAKGLEYLHEGCKSKIIHCDVKPDNILYDNNHTPRITDFGIAKLLGDQQTKHTITTVAGTPAYLAPEWFDGEGRVDSKVDVYSFGVVLLEMICCRKAKQLVQGEADTENVERFACVAIWCLRKDPSIRPNMSKVVQMLEGTVEVDPLPDPPRPPSFSAILPSPTNSANLHSNSRVHALHIG